MGDASQAAETTSCSRGRNGEPAHWGLRKSQLFVHHGTPLLTAAACMHANCLHARQEATMEPGGPGAARSRSLAHLGGGAGWHLAGKGLPQSAITSYSVEVKTTLAPGPPVQRRAWMPSMTWPAGQRLVL